MVSLTPRAKSAQDVYVDAELAAYHYYPDDWKRAEVYAIQREAGVDLETAVVLFRHRHVPTALSEEEHRRCEAIEQGDYETIWDQDDRERRAGRVFGPHRANGTMRPRTQRVEEKPHVKWTLPLMKWRDPATIPRRQFLYGYYYARGVLSATVADGGKGKSILQLAELLAMITGRNLLGVTPQERVRALYWSGDESYDELDRRIHAIAKHYDIDLKPLLDDGWLTLGTSDEHPLCLAAMKRGSL